MLMIRKQESSVACSKLWRAQGILDLHKNMDRIDSLMSQLGMYVLQFMSQLFINFFQRAKGYVRTTTAVRSSLVG